MTFFFPFPRPSKSELRTLSVSTVKDQPGSSRDQPREVAGSCPSYSAMPSWDRGGRLTMVPCISANLPTVLVAFLHFSCGLPDLLVPPRLARCTKIGSLPPSQKNLRVKYKSTDDTLRRKGLVVSRGAEDEGVGSGCGTDLCSRGRALGRGAVDKRSRL